jgi:hypothetical protein
MANVLPFRSSLRLASLIAVMFSALNAVNCAVWMASRLWIQHRKKGSNGPQCAGLVRRCALRRLMIFFRRVDLVGKTLSRLPRTPVK